MRLPKTFSFIADLETADPELSPTQERPMELLSISTEVVPGKRLINAFLTLHLVKKLYLHNFSIIFTEVNVQCNRFCAIKSEFFRSIWKLHERVYCNSDT
jgi:hypothetical protein